MQHCEIYDFYYLMLCLCSPSTPEIQLSIIKWNEYLCSLIERYLYVISFMFYVKLFSRWHNIISDAISLVILSGQLLLYTGAELQTSNLYFF